MSVHEVRSGVRGADGGRTEPRSDNVARCDTGWNIRECRLQLIVDKTFNDNEEIMVRVRVLYRNLDSATFDFDYYVNSHLKLARRRLGDFGMGRIDVEKGIEAMDGGSAPYLCVAHVEFSDMDELKRGMERHAEELLADVPNYTNIEPEVQISEVV